MPNYKKYLLANGWKQVGKDFESPFHKETFDLENAIEVEYMLKGYEYVMKKVKEINEN